MEPVHIIDKALTGCPSAKGEAVTFWECRWKNASLRCENSKSSTGHTPHQSGAPPRRTAGPDY